MKKVEAEAKRRGSLPPTCEMPVEVDLALLNLLTDEVRAALATSAFNTVDFASLFGNVGIGQPAASS